MKPGAELAGRFEILREIGRGGLARVYEARDRTLDQTVALKVLLPHLAEQRVVRQRFRREVALSRRLVHPAIVRVHDLFEDDDAMFFSMELCQGVTLKEHLRGRGIPPFRERRAIVATLCEALAAAHAEGIVHRDIKPQNVMRADDGAVRVLDFGLAHVEAMAGLTSHSVLMGTPEYMAPETAAGDPVDGRADLYSLGVLWFELATGALPFPSGSPLEHLKQITEHDGPAPAGEGVDDAETAIVGRLLRRSPGERYASADEVREALARREGTVERALALPRRVCAVCGADEPTGPGFCLACGADVLTVASAPGDSVLVLTRHEEGVAPLLELPPLMGRFGAEVDPAEVGGEVAPAPPVVVLKGVDAGFARRVQQDLLPAGFTCEVRRLAEENFDLLRGRHTPPAVYVGALLLGWGAACFAAHAVYGTVGLVLAFAAGPPMGWLLVRQTHLFLSPLFRPVDETDDPTAMAMSAHYRQFLERTRSGSLRRLGATLMARASLLLARLDDEAVAPTARRSLTGLAVDATRRGLDTLAALQPVDELLQSADARHIWEELEQTEARIRRDDEGDGGSPDREQAEGLERELRQLSDLEHERTRQIQKVLRLAVRLEAARAEVRGVEAPDEEQLSEIGRRIELDAALLADAVAETEAAVASRSPGRDST